MRLRVLIVTQDDPFFLPEALRYLFSRLPASIDLIGTVLLGASPFGKRESTFFKCVRTLRVFGLRFLIRYSFLLLVNRVLGKTVAAACNNAGIPVLRLCESINSPSSLNKMRAYAPDVIVSIAGNEIFRREFIGIAKRGVLNLHTAKLPEYRGLMPSFWVLANNEEETAVSVFYVDDGIDSGPILVQETLKIAGRSQEDLIRDTKWLGMEAIRTALVKIMNSDVETIPNEIEKSTYFGFPSRADVKKFRAAGKEFF